MQPPIHPPEITDDYLSRLEKDQLIDLLLHRTSALLAVTTSQRDTTFVVSISKEVEKIQSAIKKKN